MHEGSVRRREDGIYIIGLSVCPSGHVFIIVPSSFLMPIYLFVWQTQCPISLFKPPNNLSLDDYIMLDLQSAQSYFVQSILWTCAFQNACVFVSICEFPLQELTRALFSLRRINQASATWPRWLQPSWAQLIRVPCGPDMRRTKKQEEWEEAQDRRTSRQWMIMMTRAILLASVHPPALLSLFSSNPGLGPGSGSHMDLWSGSGRRGWSVTTRQGLVCQLLGMTGGEERREEMYVIEDGGYAQ